MKKPTKKKAPVKTRAPFPVPVFVEAKSALRPSGIPLFDKALGGGPGRGDLVVVGGAAAVGKTYFAEQLLHAHDERSPSDPRGSRVLYYTANEPAEVMLLRRHARRTGKSPLELRRSATGPALFETILHTKPSVVELADSLEGCRGGGVQAVIIDTLQRFSPRNFHGNRVREVWETVTEIRDLGRRHGFVTYLLSDLDRSAYRKDAEPLSSCCQHAADLESLADVMLMLWKSEAEPGFVKAKMAKVRWTSQRPRFLIPQDRKTGLFGPWSADFG